MSNIDIPRGNGYIEPRYARKDKTKIHFKLTKVVYESRGTASGKRDVLKLYYNGVKVGELIDHGHENGPYLRNPSVPGGNQNFVNVGVPQEFYDKIAKRALDAGIYNGPDKVVI